MQRRLWGKFALKTWKNDNYRKNHNKETKSLIFYQTIQQLIFYVYILKFKTQAQAFISPEKTQTQFFNVKMSNRERKKNG